MHVKVSSKTDQPDEILDSSRVMRETKRDNLKIAYRKKTDQNPGTDSCRSHDACKKNKHRRETLRI